MTAAFVIAGIGVSTAFHRQSLEPEPAVGVNALGAIVGEWQSSEPEGRSVSSSCAWTPRRTAVVCEHTILSKTGEHHPLNLYTFDPRTGHYSYYLVQKPGEPAETDSLTIDGALWTYHWSRPDDNGQPLRTIADFSQKGSYSWRVESSNGQHWNTISTGHAERAVRK